MGKRRICWRSKKNVNYKDGYRDILLMYQKMLLNMGILPSELDEENPQVVFEVLGARQKTALQYIDEIR